MDMWITFWKVVLVACLFLYFSLAVVITVGGIKNIKDFLQDLTSGAGNDE